MWRALTLALAAGSVAASGAARADAPPAGPRLYQLATETGMPHLDESLRYAVRHEQRCLSLDELLAAFWMLGDVSLQDCTLAPAGRDGQGARLDLVCTGGHGTSGQARWQFEADRLTGRLDVRLGGKNMTFHQRIVARPVGPCG